MEIDSKMATEFKLRTWIGAMRLRTLPLAISSTLTGAFLALHHGAFNGSILMLTALTTVLLQINSNLANDYGDFQHGTDNEQRVGPMRAMQSGAISEKHMRLAITICSALSLLSGVMLLWVSQLPNIAKAVLFVLGIAAIYASIRYTAGKNPYGYKGFGDVSVLIFFGIIGVVGAYCLQTAYFNPTILLPAISIGCLSAAVLNVNNTRDLISDQQSGKITLAVKLGAQGARNYHLFLMITAMILFIVYAAISFNHLESWLFLLAYPLFILNAVRVFKNENPAELDPYLKQLALSTFLLAFLLGISVWLEKL